MRLLVGFSTSSWWVSRVIRFFTRAPVSHTYLVFEGIPEVGHEIYEAAWCGFRISTREKLTSGTTRIVKEIPVAADVTKAFYICRSWLETPYDYAGLFGEAWVMLGKWLGKRWENPWAGAHHMFCSEAATRLLQATLPMTSPLGRVIGPLDDRQVDPYTLESALIGAGFGGDA
jgi:hypothetical protein